MFSLCGVISLGTGDHLGTVLGFSGGRKAEHTHNEQTLRSLNDSTVHSSVQTEHSDTHAFYLMISGSKVYKQKYMR